MAHPNAPFDEHDPDGVYTAPTQAALSLDQVVSSMRQATLAMEHQFHGALIADLRLHRRLVVCSWVVAQGLLLGLWLFFAWQWWQHGGTWWTMVACLGVGGCLGWVMAYWPPRMPASWHRPREGDA